MVCVGKTLKIIIQSSCQGQGCYFLDLVAQTPIQPGFEHFQECGTHKYPQATTCASASPPYEQRISSRHQI